MPKSHLAILKSGYVQAILEGRKTVESRFIRSRRPYFGNVAVGDTIFIKQSSGPVLAKAKAAGVKYYEQLTPARLDEIKKQYNKYILGSDEYWQSKTDCRYGVLVRLDNIRKIEPIWIKKRDWRAWVVLSEKENFGLLKLSE